MKVKWYSQDIEPSKSKNILITWDNVNYISFCGDYSFNRQNEENDLTWKMFCSHKLLLTHKPFKWCYWEDVEKQLLKDLK